MYYVYHISDSWDLKYGYIGVTNNLERRWLNHEKSKYTIGKHIQDNGWSFDDNMRIVYSGDENECYKMEYNLRPEPFMGLNEAAGGQGGNIYEMLSTIQKQIRNKKISETHKNKILSEETKNKISKTRIENQVSKGSKNPKSCRWKIISPEGKEYSVIGELQKFCDENKLLRTCLMRYLNSIVPEINAVRYGGYRPKNEISKELRYNTIGWSLYKMEK
jgi:hypothetical protein